MTPENSFALIALAAALCAAPASQAQTPGGYPTRAIRLVVPFPAGGGADLAGRLVGQKLSESMGQPVVVDNRAGASGAVGSDFVAKAAPDGYTILLGSATTHAVGPAVNSKLPYNNLTDFTAIALIATFPNMLVVNPAVPARNVAEFIAYLRANPGKVNYASSGAGSSLHLAAELFKMMTKTEMTHIPYKGSASLSNELLGGQVQCAIDNMTAVFPHVQSGKLRALGVASAERVAAAPDVPTIAETLPGYEASSWVGLFGPAGMPADIVARIAADNRRAVFSPDVSQKMRDLGSVVVGSTPQEFAAFVRKDTDRWREVAKAARITLD